jgi:tRNA threonylcarbamoyladenosine biosynthesis protein TsaE
MGCHIIHIPVPAARNPFGKAPFGSAKLTITDADLLKAELRTPALHTFGERPKIQRLSGFVVHNAHLSLIEFLAVEADTLALGADLARVLEPGLVVYLRGDLGAGKTTLVRGVLRGLGYTARVKSPTFTLVEVYEFSSLYLYHFDFYRFEHTDELADAGFREYFGEASLCLIEWPEKAPGLPAADLDIHIQLSGAGRTVELHANSEAGARCMDRLQHAHGTRRRT